MQDKSSDRALPGASMADMRRKLFGHDPSTPRAETFAHGPEPLEVGVTTRETATGVTLTKSELLSNGVVVATQG